MNKKLLIAVFVSAMAHTFACAASPKENRMKTVWADKVTSENVWQSYPRPQLQRSQWMNLNGLWQYAVTTQDTPKKEVKFEGQILVPFAIESSFRGCSVLFCLPRNCGISVTLPLMTHGKEKQ